MGPLSNPYRRFRGRRFESHNQFPSLTPGVLDVSGLMSGPVTSRLFHPGDGPVLLVIRPIRSATAAVSASASCDATTLAFGAFRVVRGPGLLAARHFGAVHGRGGFGSSGRNVLVREVIKPPRRCQGMPVHGAIPYRQRHWARSFHASLTRWSCLVLHRRAGKTTAVINHPTPL